MRFWESVAFLSFICVMSLGCSSNDRPMGNPPAVVRSPEEIDQLQRQTKEKTEQIGRESRGDPLQMRGKLEKQHGDGKISKEKLTP